MVGLLGVLFCSEELGKESLINTSAGFVLCGQEARTYGLKLRGCGPSYVAAKWLRTGLACGLAKYPTV